MSREKKTRTTRGESTVSFRNDRLTFEVLEAVGEVSLRVRHGSPADGVRISTWLHPGEARGLATLLVMHAKKAERWAREERTRERLAGKRRATNKSRNKSRNKKGRA